MISIKGFHFIYNALDSAEQTIDEIFNLKSYNCDEIKKANTIIDVGANIGVATAYFKKHFPNAEVIAIEPDSKSFKALQKNISLNKLTQVSVINAAVTPKFGKTLFYGQVSPKESDARGNSILSSWGLQRKNSTVTQVDAIQLSSLINKPISLLKIDIEGAEMMVIEEIAQKLHLVENIFIEYHGGIVTNKFNDLNKILLVLKNAGFEVTVSNCDIDILPDAVSMWAQREQPMLKMIYGKKHHDRHANTGND